MLLKKCLLLGGGLGDLASLVGLLNILDDTDSDGLTHVTDGEASEWCVGLEGLNTHWLGWDQLGHAGIVLLHELWVVLSLLGGTTIELLVDVLELACNVCGVAVKHWSVAVGDLARVLHDDNLGVERNGFLRWVALGVTTDVATTDVLDGNVLNVESNVVARDSLWHGLVVHLDGFALGGHAGRSEGDDLTWLDDTGLDAADWNCSNATDLVNILERKTEWLVNRPLWRLGSVEGVEEALALVPVHVGGDLDHVVSVEAGDRDEWDLGRVVASLLQEVGNLLLDLLVTGLGVWRGGVVHLVHGDTHLLHSKSEGEKGVLTSLAILGDTSLELTSTGGNDENGAVSLGGTSDHVLDEITVTGGIDDGDHVLGGLELPQSDIDSDTTLTLDFSLSRTQAYLKEPLPSSAASFSNFSMVRLSIPPHL